MLGLVIGLVLVFGGCGIASGLDSPEGVWESTESPAAQIFLCHSVDDPLFFTGVVNQATYLRGWLPEVSSGAWSVLEGIWYSVNLYDDPALNRGAFNFTFNDTHYRLSTGVSVSVGVRNTDADPIPTDAECWRTTRGLPVGRLHGEWSWESSPFFFDEGLLRNTSSPSVDPTPFNASHSFGDSPAYLEGHCFDADQVCQGQIIRDGSFYGQFLAALGDADTMHITIFEGDPATVLQSLNLGTASDDPLHVYNSASRLNVTVRPQDAALYQVMIFDGRFGGTFGGVEIAETFDLCSNPAPGSSSVVLSAYYFEDSIFRGVEYSWERRQLVGYFFDPGYSFRDGSPTFGQFALTVSADWTVLSGGFRNTPQRYDLGPFPRKSFTRPTETECLVNSAPESPLSGIFQNGNSQLALCSSGDSFNASFMLDGEMTFATGRCFPDYGICNGNFLSNAKKGMMIFAIRTAVVAQMDCYIGDYISLDLPDATARQTLQLLRTSTLPTSSKCRANQVIGFVGEWSERFYGGSNFITYDPATATLFGFYSQIGVLRGPYNPETSSWEAEWYEPGLFYPDDGLPTSGFAQFQMVDLDSFVGSYQFINSPSVSYDWGLSTRISSLQPRNSQSWFAPISHTPLIGTFGLGNVEWSYVWFCEDEGTVGNPDKYHPYYARYNILYDGKLTEVLSQGGCSGIYRVCRGTYTTPKGEVTGQAIFSLTDTNGLYRSTTPGNYPFNSTTTHSFAEYNRIDSNADLADCLSSPSPTLLPVGVLALVWACFVVLF